jgi:peptidoglycan/xylan/chitin deacetylase (PgdA/CDA1 family)
MQLTMVIYHYVRELKYSRYPEIKGLSTDEFREQLGYIQRHYNVIGGDDLLDAVDAGAALPPRPLMLTFDDGYIDHFSQVFPILYRQKVSGCFFPSARCILNNQVLDVNKIHFILASVPDKTKIVEQIFHMLGEHGLSSQDQESLWSKFAIADRFDTKEVVFIKRMLQRELPDEVRYQILNFLFRKFVSADEISFAKELYMNTDQIRCMRGNGMYIGSHGYDHTRLNSLDQAAQVREVDLSLAFLEQVGARTDRWIMCYPYGSYDSSLISILKSKNCTIGLTIKVGIADLSRDNLLALPRLDTNDLPKKAEANPNQWTLEAMTA